MITTQTQRLLACCRDVIDPVETGKVHFNKMLTVYTNDNDESRGLDHKIYIAAVSILSDANNA